MLEIALRRVSLTLSTKSTKQRGKKAEPEVEKSKTKNIRAVMSVVWIFKTSPKNI